MALSVSECFSAGSFRQCSPSKATASMKWSTDKCAKWIKVLVLLITASIPLYSQAPSSDAGVPEFSTWDSHGYDSVNLQSLSVMVDPQIFTKNGLIPFSYSSVSISACRPILPPGQSTEQWECTGSPSSGQVGLIGSSAAASYVFGQYCPDGRLTTWAKTWTITTPEGTQHSVSDGSQNGGGVDSLGCYSTSYTGVATDSSGYTLNIIWHPSPTPWNLTIADRHGNYTTAASNTYNYNSETDSNGNSISVPVSDNGIGSYTDTLGVTALTVSTVTGFPPGIPGAFAWTGPGSSTQEITTTVAPYTEETNFGCGNPKEQYATNVPFITAYNYPDGSSLQIGYESAIANTYTGRIASITLRTGATIRYNYTGVNCGDGHPLSLTRTTPDGITTYTAVENYSTQQTVTTVRDPLGNKFVYTFYGAAAINQGLFYGPWITGKAVYQNIGTVQAPAYSSTPLSSDTICYNGTPWTCATSSITYPIVSRNIIHSLSGMSTSSIVAETYDQYGNTTSTSKYDFGATSPTETIQTSFGSWNGSSCVGIGNYINDRPCEVAVSNGSVTLSDTRFTYDSHGNPTQTQQWVTGSTWLTTSTAQYNSNGTISSSTDSNNNTTTYGYNSGCTNPIFPTSITKGGLTTRRTWDCFGGVQTSATDVNGRVTTYSYVGSPSGSPDPFWRQLSVAYPDGGGMTTQYAPGEQSISTSTALIPGLGLNKTTLFDGLGRENQTQLTSDPDGTDYVDTSYDPLGRKATVSNPHRSGSLPTDGTTSYTYDAVNRLTSVIEPDGSSKTTVYSGNCSTVTDETGSSRESCVDGLGRLIAVWEDPGSSPHYNYETDYQYDALGNLVCVVQKGTDTSRFTSCSSAPASWRPRGFQYDGLSRMTSSTTPESGAISYSYTTQSGGQCSGEPTVICRRTALSPNQPAFGTFTVTTTNAYDSLTRLTAKTYQDSYPGNSPTAAVRYGYDGTALPGCATSPPALTDTNPLGQRTSMCDGSGATAWAHDSMGRILQESRTIGGVNGVHETDGYNVGGLIKDVSALGQVTGYTYNGAGRPISIGLGTNNSYPYVSNATYLPFGGLATVNLGLSPISVSDSYNNRLQPTLISASNSSATRIINLSFDFHSSSRTNNGNVYQITNNRDGNRTVNFSYDSLNRIVNAFTTGPNWGESYTIDAWGNLTNIGSYQNKNQSETLNCSAANSLNQLSTCYVYDAAGNLVNNGTFSYIYDAENRLISAGGMSYIYDGDGKRVEKCTAGTTPGACSETPTGTLYWNGWGDGPLAETDLGGNVVADYIYFNGLRIARVDSPSGSVHYYFSDHLGTHSLITDATGDMPPQEESDFYPYGGEIPISGSDSNHYKFTGKERDSESALDNFGARITPPALGAS